MVRQYRPRVFGGVLLSWIACLAPPALAQVTIKTETTYYSVSGRTAEAVGQSIMRNAPMVDDGRSRAVGQTRLRFSAQYNSATNNEKCAAAEPQVDVTITVLLPRWSDETRSDQTLQIFWRGFSSYVQWHEEQHVKIARKHAERLRRVFSNVPAAPNCQLLKMRMEAAARDVIALHNREQLQFDRQERRRANQRIEAEIRKQLRASSGG